MKQYLNTLFVTTQGAYLAKEGHAAIVRHQKQTLLRVPLHNLGGIVCFGRIGVSPALLGLCGQAGVAVSFLTESGRFLARAQGFTSGNVLLRRTQYRTADDPKASTTIARAIVTAKILNSRTVLLRFSRDYPDAPGAAVAQRAAIQLAGSADSTQNAADLDALRGLEGDAARTYFDAFNHLVTAQQADFIFTGRNRRPPLDRVNSLLSFLYSMLAHDLRSACEASGLDPAVGFLHTDRPGRPSLALDLMEEFRAFFADRLALSLINRRQVQADGFQITESGGVLMSEAARKSVIVAYQKRKQEEINHPFLEERVSVGLLPHLQARLLARHLRGDLDQYPPFIWK